MSKLFSNMASASRGTDEHQFVNIFVGAETGLLKGVNVANKTWRNVNDVETASREREIVSLCWANTPQTQVCLGLRDRTVQVYDTQKAEVTESHSFLGGEGTFRGLYCDNSVFTTCTESGLLRVWDSEHVRMEMNVGPQIQRMRQNQHESHLVATGGKDNDLKVWDLQSGTTEPVFKAKNVKNDWLNLMVPIWVTDIAFLPDSGNIVTCTGHHQIRVYDPRSEQRRPVLDMEFDEYPFTTMGLRFGGNQVVVGNTHGRMALMDLRGKGHMVHCYRGFAGSIRCVACHPTLPLVASCGLDRYLRIHDLEQQHLLNKFYLKSRLNCLLFAERWSHDDKLPSSAKYLKITNINRKKLATEDASMHVDREDDQLWAKMEVVTAKSNKRKTPTRGNSGEREKGKRGRKARVDCSVTVAMDLGLDDVVKTKHKKKERKQKSEDKGMNKKTSKDATRKLARKKKKTV